MPDFCLLGQLVTAFERAKRIRVAEHRRVHAYAPVYECGGGDMVDQIMTGDVLGVSTVVYNLRKVRSTPV